MESELVLEITEVLVGFQVRIILRKGDAAARGYSPSRMRRSIA
jgi:hypothetical protein